jgi:hypothetical protein
MAVLSPVTAVPVHLVAGADGLRVPDDRSARIHRDTELPAVTAGLRSAASAQTARHAMGARTKTLHITLAERDSAHA